MSEWVSYFGFLGITIAKQFLCDVIKHIHPDKKSTKKQRYLQRQYSHAKFSLTYGRNRKKQCITNWHVWCTAQDRKALQQVLKKNTQNIICIHLTSGASCVLSCCTCSMFFCFFYVNKVYTVIHRGTVMVHRVLWQQEHQRRQAVSSINMLHDLSLSDSLKVVSLSLSLASCSCSDLIFPSPSCSCVWNGTWNDQHTFPLGGLDWFMWELLQSFAFLVSRQMKGETE